MSLPSVPRSNGCVTCIARKTRCDGRRPGCLACEKRLQTCGGYKRGRVVFMSDGWRAPGVATGKSSPRQTDLSKIPSRSSSGFFLDQGKLQEKIHCSNGLFLYRNPSIDKSRLHAAFFLASFGTRPGQALSPLGQLFRQYLSYVPSITQDGSGSSLSSQPVVLAVDALAYCHFGAANADSLSLRRSLDKYGSALRAMSLKLSSNNYTDSDFHDMTEDEWRDFAFYCLVMAFWEMKMLPVSRNWESHIRCLAAAVARRGSNFSQANHDLLASSRLLLTIQTLASRGDDDWQQCSSIRFAWASELRLAFDETNDVFSGTPSNYLSNSIDSAMAEFASIGRLFVEYETLIEARSMGLGLPTLLSIRTAAEDFLARNEAHLAAWSLHIHKVSASSWLSSHPELCHDHVASAFWSRQMQPAVQTCFSTVLTFGNMLKYQSVSLYWTIIILLRLLLSDILALMGTTKLYSESTNWKDEYDNHRHQLMKYAQMVLQTISYATCKENREAGPFVFATAFQVAACVLHRECSLLREPGCSRDAIQQCGNLKSLAVYYLDWITQNKIPVRLDLRALPMIRRVDSQQPGSPESGYGAYSR